MLQALQQRSTGAKPLVQPRAVHPMRSIYTLEPVSSRAVRMSPRQSHRSDPNTVCGFEGNASEIDPSLIKSE